MSAAARARRYAPGAADHRADHGADRRSRRAGRRSRRALAAVGMVGAAALLAGCGIRETEGPINAGEPAKRPQGTATSPVFQHPIYLVRNGRLDIVLRGDAVNLPDPGRAGSRPPTPGDPLRMSLIDRLLRELAKGPNPDEAAQGWTTRLPKGGVRLAEPVGDDPAALVRLDLESVADLDPLALGQVVCTLQNAAKADSVLLAGRSGAGGSLSCDSFEGTGVAPQPERPVPPTASPSASGASSASS